MNERDILSKSNYVLSNPVRRSTKHNEREWLLKKAKEEDNCIISVGGLICRIKKEEEKLNEKVK